jgi:hypothetical protein
MLLLNFSHPLTEDQRAQIEALAGERISQIRRIPSQVDLTQPLAPQIAAMAEAANLSREEWQSEAILLVPPALNFSAAALLAHLHGLMGYFPPVVVMRRVPNSLPPRFEIAEILNLQEIREASRRLRNP